MNSDQYKAFVQSKLKPGKDIVDSLNDAKAHALHMAIGIAGEGIEYLEACDNDDEDNIKEELGDLLFYCQGLRLLFPTSILDGRFDNITIIGGSILDRVKKAVIYNKPLPAPLKGSTLSLEQEICQLLTSMENAIATQVKWLDTTVEALRQANAAKLDVRYKDGYSDAAAQARADKNESEGE